MSEERADAQLLLRKDDEHVSMFKARAGMGGVIMEGREISAVARYIEALEARVADAPVAPETCAWTHDESEYSWDSACGSKWGFVDDGPIENGMKFCHNCGKPLVIVAAQGEKHD